MRRRPEQLEARCYLAGDPIVQVNTNFGNFQLELFPADAPQSVANFLSYVDSDKYADAVFSRSITNYIVQAGGITSASATYTSNSQFVPVSQGPTIPLEYKLPNTAGTIAMARGTADNTASDEWFINLGDNTTALGPGGVSKDGYAVFGQVIGNGMQTINAIAAVPTQNKSDPNVPVDLQNLPIGANNQLVQISSMTLLDSVYGTVFTDSNGNGTQDSGEAGVAGRTVFVDVDGSGQPDSNNPSAVTDANGNYVIGAVPAGSFPVREVLPSGASLTTTLQTVTFATTQAASNVNFGESIPSISGTVFTDLNGNGQLASGDPGVAGRTVFLNIDKTGQPDAKNPSTTTDANGNFSFSGLAAGAYNVMEVLPANVSLSTNTQSVVVATGQTATANIGELPSIVGSVFNDVNVNGKFDSGEPGIAGATVFVNIDGSGAPSNSNPSAITDANGRYFFSGLAPGSYTVDEVITPDHGTTLTTTTAPVTVVAGQSQTDDIGNVLTSTIVPLPVSMNTSTPPSSTNAAFIDDLYFTVLGHHADSASLTNWQQKMAGGTTRSDVAKAIWDSSEHRGLQVEQYYHTFLGRNSDPPGKTFWVNSFQSWDSEKIMPLGFVTSAEYSSLHVADADFVAALYHDLLRRPASSSELTFWENALSQGQSRLDVAKTFVDGQEVTAQIVDSFYPVFLHRAADSTTQGMVTDIQNGTMSVESAAVSVLASDEFFALAGTVG
ncbi:MAG TPA: SdrD B-like domain-containing protein [Pirellulales bacterium]|nr:SdrD B-like domain-containing protein [Pirellulales bacterium]